MFKGPDEKICPLYLEQISNNETEKFGDLKQFIDDDRLPRINGKINILELGVGSGETVKKLKDQIHNRNDVNIIGLDNAFMFADNFRQKTGADSVVADAGMFSIKAESLSAVNASAILHEVSSYGVNTDDRGRVFGVEAVGKALSEIKRCLAEDGILAYRDVACPENRLEIKTVDYDRKSWQIFLESYIPILRDASKEVFPEILDGYDAGENNDVKRIEASAQMHREIQRHYITFRDYFRKKVFPELGIKIIREEWIEKEQGNKQHAVELSEIALQLYIDRISADNKIDGLKNMSIDMQSDEYDDFTDMMIEYAMEKQTSDFHEEWFRREGREIYTYLDSHELKKMVCEKKDSVNTNPSTLEAISQKLIPRNYYQRYLNRVIKNPEFEGKQVINFTKKTYDE